MSRWHANWNAIQVEWIWNQCHFGSRTKSRFNKHGCKTQNETLMRWKEFGQVSWQCQLGLLLWAVLGAWGILSAFTWMLSTFQWRILTPSLHTRPWGASCETTHKGLCLILATFVAHLSRQFPIHYFAFCVLVFCTANIQSAWNLWNLQWGTAVTFSDRISFCAIQNLFCKEENSVFLFFPHKWPNMHISCPTIQPCFNAVFSFVAKGVYQMGSLGQFNKVHRAAQLTLPEVHASFCMFLTTNGRIYISCLSSVFVPRHHPFWGDCKLPTFLRAILRVQRRWKASGNWRGDIKAFVTKNSLAMHQVL